MGKKWHPLTRSGCHDYRCAAERTERPPPPPSSLFHITQTAEERRDRFSLPYQSCWFEGCSIDVFTDLAVEKSPALVWRCRPQLWPGVSVHSLIPHASMLLQGGRKKRIARGWVLLPRPSVLAATITAVSSPCIQHASCFKCILPFPHGWICYCPQLFQAIRERGISERLQKVPC